MLLRRDGNEWMQSRANPFWWSLHESPATDVVSWDKLHWKMMPRGQTGYAAHALAGIDIALWDIKGKVLGQPIWRPLGGARARVPVYGTF